MRASSPQFRASSGMAGLTSLGRFGEAWAAGLLTRRGYRVVDRNVRFREGEIDLIAYDGDELVFVEVKCRRSRRFGSPVDAITPIRFARLATAIQLYLTDRGLSPERYRVDVVTVEVDPGGRVAHWELLRAVESPAR